MATERGRRIIDDVPAIGWLVDQGWAARLFGILIGLGAWIWLASVFPNRLMPFPLETLSLAWDITVSGAAFTHIGWTLWLTLLSFVGTMIVGGAIGVAMGVNHYSKRFGTPYIIAGLSVPAVALAAAATLIFGFGSTAPVVATVIAVFPFVAINVWKGVESLESDYIEMSKAFDVSVFRILRRVVIPNAAPSLFTAMRFGLALSWKVVTVVEIFAGSKGVGYKIMQTYQLYRFEEAWAWAVLFLIVILIIEYGFFKPLERKVFEYRQDADFQLLA
ncbi:ABC transporter permease [Halomicroarcula sp. GCM10025324]|uniref:ABC transporter permease n=1 Tax=Haloarcula TaxID=2237 RepID=UPI0023E88698|nr:ABC transporter permease subunit [Halomicroarcula sp. ZS-22-S1]